MSMLPFRTRISGSNSFTFINILIYIKKEFPVIAQEIVFSVNCKIILNSKFKSMACISLLLCYRAGDTRGLVAIPPLPPTALFCVAKERKKKSFNEETIKRLTNVQNVTVLAILERLEFKNFSCHPTVVTGNTFQCSIASSL